MDQYFQGKITDIRTYDTVLTSAEIQQIYNNEKGGKICMKNKRWFWILFIVSTFISAIITGNIISWIFGILCWSVAICIGTNKENKEDRMKQYFQGRITDIRMYDTAITNDEIQQIYNNEKGSVMVSTK